MKNHIGAFIQGQIEPNIRKLKKLIKCQISSFLCFTNILMFKLTSFHVG